MRWGCSLWRDKTSDQDDSQVKAPGSVTLPVLLRLVHTGEGIHVFASKDGVQWGEPRMSHEASFGADPEAVDKHRDLLAAAELIFMDGPHDGATETAMMQQLQTVAFASPPLLVFDDIKLPALLKFWRDLPLARLDITSFGQWGGTGLAEWAGGSEQA